LINCLDCGYVLGQYMNIKHSLLYKTWTVALRRRRETYTCVCVCVANTDKGAKILTCYMTDSSSRQGQRPTTNKIATVLTTAKIWSWVPEGLIAKMDWLTDMRHSVRPEAGGSMTLRSVGSLLHYYTVW
jgi:hypothetical protein